MQSEEETAQLDKLERLSEFESEAGVRRRMKLKHKTNSEYGMCNKFDIHVSHTRNFNAMNMHLQYQIHKHMHMHMNMQRDAHL